MTENETQQRQWDMRYSVYTPCPCQQCTDKHVLCHSKCEKYKAFRKKHEENTEKYRKYKEKHYYAK